MQFYSEINKMMKEKGNTIFNRKTFFLISIRNWNILKDKSNKI